MSWTPPAFGIPSPASDILPPASGIPSPIWYPTIPVWYPTIHIWYPTIPVWYSSHVWYPTIPVWYPIIPIWYSNTLVWNLTMCVEPHPIPCLVSHPSTLPPLSCPQYPPPSGHCCSFLASNYPLPPDLAPACPPSWTPAHATPTTPSNCHLALMHHPIPPSWPSGPPCPTAPAPSGSLPSTSCPTTPAIWLSCPWHPLPPLPSGTPGPNSLSHLAPCHCPSCPHYPHPNLDLLPPPHQISSPKVPSTQKENLSFSEFPSFLMFVSISPCVGSISSRVKIISFISRGKIPKIVVKATPFPSIRVPLRVTNKETSYQDITSTMETQLPCCDRTKYHP